MGSMAAGGFTGLLYKSTGEYDWLPLDTFVISSYFVWVSWRQTCLRGGGLHGRHGGGLESYQKERVNP